MSRIESATKFATQYGNPVVTAIDRYREDNGEYPADMRDQLIPGYVDEIHPAWYLQTDGGPVLSTRLFPFEDWFLTWNFEERRWRLGTIELNVEQPH
jgi:hypothetical protein